MMQILVIAGVALQFSFVLPFFWQETSYPKYHTPPTLNEIVEEATVEKLSQLKRTKRTPVNDTELEVSREKSKRMTKLLDNLLKKYDMYIRPGFGGPPLTVKSNMVMTSMGPFSDFEAGEGVAAKKISIDPESGVTLQADSGGSRNKQQSTSHIPEFTFQCFIRHFWQDERLNFSSVDNTELVLNSIMLNKVWKPDTFFRGNGQNSYIHDMTRPNQLFRLSKAGTITFSSRLTISAKCPMDFSNFPMDRQKCTVEFGSFGYEMKDLIYDWKEADGVKYVDKESTRLAQFVLTETKHNRRTIGNYSVLAVEFYFERNLGYFIMQTYLPCVMIVILSWVAFWINREAAPARISLGITTDLTMTTFAISARQQIPKVSYPSAMDWYVLMCYLFVFLALVEYAAVNYFTKRGEGGKIPPKPKVPDSPPTKRLKLHGGERDDVDESNDPPFDNMSSLFVKFFVCLCGSMQYKKWKMTQITTQFNSVSQIDEFCRIYFPCSFILFNFVYWSIYL